MSIDYKALAQATARTLAASLTSAETSYSTYFGNPDNAGSSGKVEWFLWGGLYASYGLEKPTTCYIQSGTAQSVVMSSLATSMTITLVTTDSSNIGKAIQAGTATIDTDALTELLYTCFDSRLTSRGTAIRRPQAISNPKVKVFGAIMGPDAAQVDLTTDLFPVKLDPVLFLTADTGNTYCGPYPILDPSDINNYPVSDIPNDPGEWGDWIRRTGLLGVAAGAKASLNVDDIITYFSVREDYEDVGFDQATFDGLIYIDMPSNHGIFWDNFADNSTFLDSESYIAGDYSGGNASYNNAINSSWGFYASKLSRAAILRWHKSTPNAWGIAIATPIYTPKTDYSSYLSQAGDLENFIGSSANRGLFCRTPVGSDNFTELSQLAVVLRLHNDDGIVPEGSDVANDVVVEALSDRIGAFIDAIRVTAPETPIVLRVDLNNTAGDPVSATYLDILFREVIPNHVIHGILLYAYVADANDYVDIVKVIAPHLAQLQRNGLG